MLGSSAKTDVSRIKWEILQKLSIAFFESGDSYKSLETIDNIGDSELRNETLNMLTKVCCCNEISDRNFFVQF